MLKAALEALKKTEQQQQAALATTQSVPSKHGLDSDEEGVLDLLDEISTIQPTFTAKAARREEEQCRSASSSPSPSPSFSPSPAPPESSSLFDLEELEGSLLQASVASMGPMTIASRPFVGQSPTAALAPVPPPSSPAHLPFPINPDGFNAPAFASNWAALSRLFAAKVDPAARMPIAQIPSVDRHAKIPLVAGMLVAIDQPSGRDYLVTLADDTGTVQATVHEGVPRELRTRLHYGMMMVLGDVTVYRPTPKAQCLVAVPRNVKYLVPNTHSAP